MLFTIQKVYFHTETSCRCVICSTLVGETLAFGSVPITKIGILTPNNRKVSRMLPDSCLPISFRYHISDMRGVEGAYLTNFWFPKISFFLLQIRLDGKDEKRSKGFAVTSTNSES